MERADLSHVFLPLNQLRQVSRSSSKLFGSFQKGRKQNRKRLWVSLGHVQNDGLRLGAQNGSPLLVG